MSKNEDNSLIDPDYRFPTTKFDAFPASAEVRDNRLLVTDSLNAEVDLGDFRLASAVYIVGGYINPQGRAVVVFSDGNEVVLNKVTTDKVYQVTMEGTGYFTGNDKSKLQFTPLETNFPMTFDGKSFAFASTNGLRLDRYVRLDHLTAYPAGRSFTSWTPIPIGRIINNLGVAVSGNFITLPAGNYYVKIIAQHFRGVVGYAALIATSNNLPIMLEAVSVSHTDGSGAQLLTSQKISLAEDTQVYFGNRTSTAQAQTYALGLGMTPDIDTTYNLFNSVEIWRLND